MQTKPAHKRLRISWLKIYSIIVVIYLLFPLFIITLFSFNSTPAISFPIRGLSLRWYGEVFRNPIFISSLKNSLLVASFTTLLCVSVGILAALATTRYKFRLKGAVRGLFLLPLSLPGLFIGISLLSYFISLQIKLSLGTVIIGHLIYTLPYFFLVASTRLERFDRILEEAAQDLGCTPWQTFWKVNFPIIAPSIIGAATIVFALSFDEFLITFFVIGTESTLPMLVWSMMRRSIDPRVNAISVVLIISSILLLYLMSKVVDISEIEL
jgi:ABC-type spermidine/putrescine transport system permease subunit II